MHSSIIVTARDPYDPAGGSWLKVQLYTLFAFTEHNYEMSPTHKIVSNKPHAC